MARSAAHSRSITLLTLPAALLSALLASPVLRAQDSDVVEREEIIYWLSFPEPHTHYVEVEALVPTEGKATLELFMANWTPGSYKIRDYARHVEDLRARPDEVGATRALAVVKTAKNRWRIQCGDAEHVRLTYRVYCREMSVRTNWVEEGFAFLNGAATFISVVGGPVSGGLVSGTAIRGVSTPCGPPRRHMVNVRLPEPWSRCVTALPPDEILDDGKTFDAPDYDTLVDCPLVLGDPEVLEFEVAGVPHRMVHLGGEGLWDGERTVADARAIVEENLRLWGSLPYEHYDFLNVIAEAGGGLEHRNCALMLTSRWSYRDAKRYRGWLGLVSHEFFHTWNVKRVRPAGLGPFDYEHEVLTPSLWIAEGTTSYYDDLLLLRAGLLNEKQYLERLSKGIEHLQRTPGRGVRSLSLSSQDAWIRHYQPDENSRNATISYYTKGAIVSFLLDAMIREVTEDARSLDDVLRLVYTRYSGTRGYTEAAFRACASEVAGTDLAEWFAEHVDSTDELDYFAALDYFGLRFRDPDAQDDEAELDGEQGEAHEEDADEEEIPGWLGLDTRDERGRLVVNRVARDTPAYTQGFNVGDEIVAVETFRVTPASWATRKKQYRPGDRATFLIARRQRLMTIDVVFERDPGNPWRLEIDPDADEEDAAHRKAWWAPTRPHRESHSARS